MHYAIRDTYGTTVAVTNTYQSARALACAFTNATQRTHTVQNNNGAGQ